MTTSGTSHFVSRAKLIKYYKSQEYDLAAINQKIREGECSVGRPDIIPGDSLVVDEDGRYLIRWGERPTMYGENERLFDAALSEGKTFFKDKGYQYLKNPDGSYFGWPVGFITGPQVSHNGSPNPYSMSVNGPGGWHQRSGTYRELDELKAWAVETQKRILSEIE